MNPEAELIARCRRGESQAWNELFDLHYAPTARFIFQLSSDLSKEDSEEICQDAFLSVIRNLNSFRGTSRLQTWIFRIASNKTRDHLDKKRAAKRGGGQATLSLQTEDSETGQTPDPPSDAARPDELLCNAETATQVGSALGQLGQPCREIIHLRYFADLSYEEISCELELNQKTVSSRLSKCLDQLEKILPETIVREKNAGFPV
jgi:RNA polymerase sigma-70 factor (ECF subfamily)